MPNSNETNRGQLPRPIREYALSCIEDFANQGREIPEDLQIYLEPLLDLHDPTHTYGIDSADTCLAYFLGNARPWKGQRARAYKAEIVTYLHHPTRR